MILTPSAENIARAAREIRAGNLVAFPTETVYGLGADALNEKAVQRIYELKQRPSFNPLIVHVRSSADFERYAHCSAQQLGWLKTLDVLWPGPLSVVLPRSKLVPDIVSASQPSVALRVPDHPVAQQLLEAAGTAIAAPSANPSGYVSPTSAEHVESSFGAAAPLILDGGACRAGIESTIISLLEDQPLLLRPGAVTLERLQELLGPIAHRQQNHSDNAPALAPGMLASHYAPKARVIFHEHYEPGKYQDDRVAQVCFSSQSSKLADAQEQRLLSSDGNGEQIAQRLFACLRELDQLGVDIIVVDRPSEQGLGLAILDRLIRAASPK